METLSKQAQLFKQEQEFTNPSIHARKERRVCDDCGNASMHYVVYKHGKAVIKRCGHCYTASAHEDCPVALVQAANEAWGQ